MKINYKKYLLISSCFIVYFVIRYKISYYLISLMKIGEFTNMLCYPFSYYIYHLFFNSLFGVLIGITYILDERKKVGQWNIDKNKIIFLLIPLLILSLGEFIYYHNINIFLIRIIIEYFNISLTLIQILFGHVLIKSFYIKEITD